VRIVRGFLLALVVLVVAVIAASAVYDAVTSDANVPVTRLWHGRFAGGTAYRSWGTHGTPVVLLGGFLEPSFVWSRVGPLLARRHRVYALDLDGFGYSRRQGPWTLQGWTAQVERFDRALGLHRPIVAGHSLGAAIAVELARRGDASAAVLVDGDAIAGGGPPRWLRAVLARTPFLTTLLRVLPGQDWLVRRILDGAYAPRHPRLDDAEVARWTRPFRAAGTRKAFVGIAQAGIPGYSEAALRRMHVRARVVWGAEDGVDAVSAGRATARDLHAPLTLLPNTGHLSPLEAPARVAAVIAG
jgi:pimeloyl-ACP methyl ester carboxylesterase